MQDKKLVELVEEFSMSGKQAHKLIANALPGGFSVVAIKKNLARLGLEVSGQGNKAASGSDDSDDAASDGGDRNNEGEEDADDFNGDAADRSAADPLRDLDGKDARPSKKSATPKQRKRNKKLFDAIAKKQRSTADGVPGDLLDDGDELADDLMVDDASIRNRDGVQSASDDDLPGGTNSSDERRKELQKLATQQRKPRPEKVAGKAQKAAPVRKNKSPKQALAAALGELVAEAQLESGGAHSTLTRISLHSSLACMTKFV